MAQRLGILAPAGRDAAVIEGILGSAGVAAKGLPTMPAVVAALAGREIGALVLAEEAVTASALAALEGWLSAQPPWSDLPVVLLTHRGRAPALQTGLAQRLGNVTLLERPLHPVSLVAAARAALRARARQHEAERHVEEIAAERAALAESERRYRTLFETLDEGFCVIEFLDGPEGPLSDYVHTEANPAYQRHAGIPDIVGKRLRQIVSPSEADAWAAIYARVLETGEPVRFERELLETGRHLELSSFRIEPAERRQVAVLFQDVTARKRAERRLRVLNETLERRVAEALAERRLLADLVEGTDSFVQVLGRDFRWLAINRSAKDEFERVYGHRPEVGDSVLELIGHPPDREAAKALWARALGGERFTVVQDFGDPGRDRRAYELSFALLRDAAGEPVGAYQFGQDVTERLRDQERLAEATARMHEMAKLETLGQLTGGVAHDFNNLLTPIVGALDLLRRRADGDERSSRLIEGAMQGAERATVLVQRLLGFARRQHLETRAVDVGALVEGMGDLIRRSIGPLVPVEVAVEPGLRPARVDPNQLELAVLNLAVNARDAMEGDGRIAIQVGAARAAESGAGLARGDYVRVSVAATGRSMDEAKLARAVEPFFTTKEPGKGTGLGLSMIHGLAAQSGGALRLRSRVGEGTVAELWLPVSREEAEEAPEAEDGPGPQSRPATILLVDDDDLVRAATEEMLKGLGHRVLAEATAAGALGVLSDGAEVDLLVSDHLMPGMRGTRLIAEARALRPGLPALLVTGYAQLGEEEAQGVPRLPKPFREADLARQIARLVPVG